MVASAQGDPVLRANLLEVVPETRDLEAELIVIRLSAEQRRRGAHLGEQHKELLPKLDPQSVALLPKARRICENRLDADAFDANSLFARVLRAGVLQVPTAALHFELKALESRCQGRRERAILRRFVRSG